MHQQSGWTATPSRLIGASTSAIPIIFMPDALPYTTLPIYPGLEQAPNMLACIPGGLVQYVERKRVFLQVCCLSHLMVVVSVSASICLVNELWKNGWLDLDAIWGDEWGWLRHLWIRWVQILQGEWEHLGDLPMSLDGIFECIFKHKCISLMCEKFIIFPFSQYIIKIVI